LARVKRLETVVGLLLKHAPLPVNGQVTIRVPVEVVRMLEKELRH
jgi:hypothetical protein